MGDYYGTENYDPPGPPKKDELGTPMFYRHHMTARGLMGSERTREMSRGTDAIVVWSRGEAGSEIFWHDVRYVPESALQQARHTEEMARASYERVYGHEPAAPHDAVTALMNRGDILQGRIAELEAALQNIAALGELEYIPSEGCTADGRLEAADMARGVLKGVSKRTQSDAGEPDRAGEWCLIARDDVQCALNLLALVRAGSVEAIAGICDTAIYVLETGVHEARAVPADFQIGSITIHTADGVQVESISNDGTITFTRPPSSGGIQVSEDIPEDEGDDDD